MVMPPWGQTLSYGSRGWLCPILIKGYSHFQSPLRRFHEMVPTILKVSLLDPQHTGSAFLAILSHHLSYRILDCWSIARIGCSSPDHVWSDLIPPFPPAQDRLWYFMCSRFTDVYLIQQNSLNLVNISVSLSNAYSHITITAINILKISISPQTFLMLLCSHPRLPDSDWQSPICSISL